MSFPSAASILARVAASPAQQSETTDNTVHGSNYGADVTEQTILAGLNLLEPFNAAASTTRDPSAVPPLVAEGLDGRASLSAQDWGAASDGYGLQAPAGVQVQGNLVQTGPPLQALLQPPLNASASALLPLQAPRVPLFAAPPAQSALQLASTGPPAQLPLFAGMDTSAFAVPSLLMPHADPRGSMSQLWTSQADFVPVPRAQYYELLHKSGQVEQLINISEQLEKENIKLQDDARRLVADNALKEAHYNQVIVQLRDECQRILHHERCSYFAQANARLEQANLQLAEYAKQHQVLTKKIASLEEERSTLLRSKLRPFVPIPGTPDMVTPKSAVLPANSEQVQQAPASGSAPVVTATEN